MTDYERLLLRFRRSTSLPPLPGTAIKLIQAIDGGEASANTLEKIIAADPGLTADLLRIAGSEGRTTSTRMAIMRLGQRAVRSLAVSMTIQGIATDSRNVGFNGIRFARHCAFVGFIARYLSVRNRKNPDFVSTWTPDEFFAAGMLHELGTALLARVAPETYDEVNLLARNDGVSIPSAFRSIFHESLTSLGHAACEAWKLPDIFTHVTRFVEQPFEADSERHSVLAVSYANGLAAQFGMTQEDWEIEPEDMSLIELEVGLPPEELEPLGRLVAEQTIAFVPEKLAAA